MTRSLRMRRLFNEWHEPIGRVLFAIAALAGIVLFTVQSVLLDFPDAPQIVGAWMWWLLVPLIGGHILAEWDEI